MGLRMIQQALRCSARVLAVCEAGGGTRPVSHIVGITAVRRLATSPLRRAPELSIVRSRTYHTTFVSASASSVMEGQGQITYLCVGSPLPQMRFNSL